MIFSPSVFGEQAVDATPQSERHGPETGCCCPMTRDECQKAGYSTDSEGGINIEMRMSKLSGGAGHFACSSFSAPGAARAFAFRSAGFRFRFDCGVCAPRHTPPDTTKNTRQQLASLFHSKLSLHVSHWWRRHFTN